MKQVKTSQDCDDVRSDQGTEYAPVQLVYLLNIFGCQWHARQSDQRRLETSPNRIKTSFENGAKKITGHVAPDQAQFGAEYFLAFTLPYFKSKILTYLLDTQKDNGPTLFNLMGQCFQDKGLTKWMDVIAKQCPNNADRTKANFDECIRDNLEAIAGFPNVGNQLNRWLYITKKPALMPMHKFMRRQVQLFSYLEDGYLC